MKSPAFSFYVRDWLCSDTVRSLHRNGGRGVSAYVYLLCESWLQVPTATLPDDRDLLAELARVDRAEFDKLWPIMEHQFISDGNGRLFHERLMEGYLSQRSHAERGSKGGKAKALAKQLAIATHLASVAKPVAKHLAKRVAAVEDANANANANPKGAKRTLGGRTSC